ncbi:MAG: FHA domain-containing protein, partial [Candidatus Brocadiaceae bacterium]
MRSGEPSEPRFYVEVNGPENDGRRFDIGPDGLLVGRSRTCDVVFRNREVSRRHAYFYQDGGACYVEDLGSKNGILVNGRIAKKRCLRAGDAVDIGPSRFFLSTVSEPRGVARWLMAGRRHAARREAEPERRVLSASDVRSALAVFSLVFGVMAYLHWVFGMCAVVLALLAYWEMRAEAFRLPRALLAGGLALGIVGATLNGWFEGVVPWLRNERQSALRTQCRANMLAIRRGL